jgi:hypothetical protein
VIYIEMLLYFSVIELNVVFCVCGEVLKFMFECVFVVSLDQNMVGTLVNVLFSIFCFYLL